MVLKSAIKDVQQGKVAEGAGNFRKYLSKARPDKLPLNSKKKTDFYGGEFDVTLHCFSSVWLQVIEKECLSESCPERNKPKISKQCSLITNEVQKFIDVKKPNFALYFLKT